MEKQPSLKDWAADLQHKAVANRAPWPKWRDGGRFGRRLIHRTRSGALAAYLAYGVMSLLHARVLAPHCVAESDRKVGLQCFRVGSHGVVLVGLGRCEDRMVARGEHVLDADPCSTELRATESPGASSARNRDSASTSSSANRVRPAANPGTLRHDQPARVCQPLRHTLLSRRDSPGSVIRVSDGIRRGWFHPTA